MGRYRRGHKQKHRNRRHRNRTSESKHCDGDSSSSATSHPYCPPMSEADWLLLERYLLDYRSAAYELHYSKQGKIPGREALTGGGIVGRLRASVGVGAYGHDSHCDISISNPPVVIGSHKFLPLTTETCKRPYIDLPDTLGGSERRKIHSLCASFDLYHSGAGGNDLSANKLRGSSTVHDSTENCGTTNIRRKRRIVISIFADGLEFVPDLPSPHVTNSLSFPSRRCRPWYYHAYYGEHSYMLGNPYEQRIENLESEKKQIQRFVNLPEQSLRTSAGAGPSFCDSLDFSVLDSLDLSDVPTPEETPWMLVDTEEKLKLCADELMYGMDVDGDNNNARPSPKVPKIHELAFDLEMCNILDGNSSYENKTGIRTCLLQLTSDIGTVVFDEQRGSSKVVYKDFIIDPLSPGVWDAIPKYLTPIFSNPNIVKIGHGIGGMDTSSLHRDFGILVVNAFDTFEASTILSARNGGMGLAKLCRHYRMPKWERYMELKQKYQASDWKRRPLDDDALAYGRYDIRFLIALRKLLMRDLIKLGMIGGVKKRFGYSIEDDSDVPASTSSVSNKGSPLLHSSDSQLSGTMNSTEAFCFENECNNNSANNNSANNNLLGGSKDAKENINEEIADTEHAPVDSIESHGASSLPTPLNSLIIHASEFPCHHYLMKSISISQKRCLKLWSGDEEEPILKNLSLISMIKEAANKKGHRKYWSNNNMKLYQSLCAWRRVSARKEKVHASEVCSLDFLVHVAYNLPENRWALRRYSYALPSLLEDESVPYCKELCELVISSDAFQNASESKSMCVVFYSGDDAKEEKRESCRELFKLLIASAVVLSTAVAVGGTLLMRKSRR